MISTWLTSRISRQTNSADFSSAGLRHRAAISRSRPALYLLPLLRVVLPVAPSFDAVGWLARSVDDLRVGMDQFGVLAVRARHARRPLRLAVVAEVLGDDDSDGRVFGAYEAFAPRAVRKRLDVVPVALGEIWKVRLAAWALCAREAFENLTAPR